MRIYRIGRKPNETMAQFLIRRNRIVRLAIQQAGSPRWEELILRSAHTWAGHIIRQGSWPWMMTIWRGEQWRLDRGPPQRRRLNTGRSLHCFWRWESQFTRCRRGLGWFYRWWELAWDKLAWKATEQSWLTWRSNIFSAA